MTLHFWLLTLEIPVYEKESNPQKKVIKSQLNFHLGKRSEKVDSKNLIENVC